MRGEMEMDFIQCEECGEKATVFDDGRPYCQECYDKIVMENMRKNGMHVMRVYGYKPKDQQPPNVPYGAQRRLLGEMEMDFIQCEECGEKATVFDMKPKDQQPPNVPYGAQRRLLGATFKETAEWLIGLLKDDEFLEELEEVAEDRLSDGYEKYGSRIYTWDGGTRYRNILEELADAFCYKSSGDV